MKPICSNCQHENEVGSSFCSNCGQALPFTCPNCASSIPADSRFCPSCGYALGGEASEATADLNRYIPDELLAKMQAARAGKTMAGERRTVTMLFADVAGSTAAAEQLDPEDWAEVINGAFERLIQPVYRYEGTLARLAGDSILAFFGAPVAHEDDPERAVMAALEMLDAIPTYSVNVEEKWGIPLEVRVGINTGLVVVGEVGSDLRVEYTALGDAINVAARMEQTATSGTLQVAEDTHRLIAPFFNTEDVGPVEVKGKSQPVNSFRVLSRNTASGDGRGLKGGTSELVGRSAELEVLQGLVAGVESGRGAIVSLIGDAGLGKSRLITELHNTATSGPLWSSDTSDTLGWATGGAKSYNSSVPYGLVVDLLHDCLDLNEGDAKSSSLTKLADLVHSVVEVSDGVLPYLADLLGLDVTPKHQSLLSGLQAPELQRRTFDALTQLIEGAARVKPVVIVLEDLHWADAVSLAFIEELMRIADRGNLLLVLSLRPYRDDRSWQVHEIAAREFDHRYQALFLNPLTASSASQLIQNLLGDDVPAATRDEIVAKSQGNPFYVEEFLNSLIDRGLKDASDVALPQTVQGLLTARLDRLESDARMVVQVASVIGREFRLDEVGHLVEGTIDLDRVLSELIRRKLLEEQGRFPERSYAFRHALVQETAYASVLRRSRRELHSKAASFLADKHPEDVQEIAHHFVEADEGRQAMPYLVTAGIRASRAMSLHDAIGFFNQALKVGGSDDSSLVNKAHKGLGAAYTMIPDLTQAASTYQEMLKLGEDAQEPSVQVSALNGLAYATAVISDDYESAQAYLEDARVLAEESGDAMGLADYHMHSCMIAMRTGDMSTAAAHDAETARLGSEAGVTQLHLGGLVQRAISLALGGRFDDGRAAVVEARREAIEANDELSLAGLDSVAMPFYSMQDGTMVDAFDAARKGAELTQRFGSQWAPQALMVTGSLASLLGDFEAGLTLLSEGLQLAEQYGQPYIASAAAGHLAAVHAALGNESKVQEYYAMSLAAMESPMGLTAASTAWCRLGWAQLEIGEPQLAVECFEKAQAPSATQQFELPSALLGQVGAHHRLGNQEEATRLLPRAEEAVADKDLSYIKPRLALIKARLLDDQDQAMAVLSGGLAAAEKMKADSEVWRLQYALARSLLTLGLREESRQSFEGAQETVARIAEHISDPGLRQSFLELTKRHARPANSGR